MQIEKAQEVCRSKEHITVSLRVTASREKSQMKVWKTFESRPHNAVSFVVEREREKEIQDWNEQKMPKVLPGYSGVKLPGRSSEAGKEEGEEQEENGERRIKNEIAQKVVECIKRKACAHEDAKSTAQRTVWQSVKQNWDCSQIENEEEKEEDDKQKENKMEVQWAEDEKLEESLERRRMEGSSVQADVMQKKLS